MFTPLLASTCTGTLEFRSVTEPIRRLSPTVNYYEGICDGIDMKTKQVNCKSSFGSEFQVPWDKLVIACGAVSNTFGIPGVQENALFLKEIEDARKIRHRILDCFEHAKKPGLTDNQVSSLLHFAIVGGGPTGVEFAAELNDLIQEDLCRFYPDLVPRVRITVYDVATRILGSFDAKLADYAMKKFARDKIRIATSTKIREVRPDSLLIESEKDPIGVGMTVWATGLTASPLIKQIGSQFQLDARQFRIMTDDRFRVKTSDGQVAEGAFAIGDCGTIEGAELPCTAQVAYQKAQHLSKILNNPGKADPFVFNNRGMMAYLGGWRAIADFQAGSHRFPGSGRIAWFFWRSAYFVMTVSLRNKILIPMYWFLAWAFGRDISRI